MLSLRSVYLVGVVRPQTNSNTKKHNATQFINYFANILNILFLL